MRATARMMFRAVLALAPLPFALCVAAGVGFAQTSFEPGEAIENAPFKEEFALSCRFDLECYEGEACTATDYTFDLIGSAGGLTPEAMVAFARMESVSGTEELLGTKSGEVMSLSGGGIDARHMLTLSEASTRYTVHFSGGPVVISYLGVCE